MKTLVLFLKTIGELFVVFIIKHNHDYKNKI